MKTSLPYYLLSVIPLMALPFDLPNPFPFIAVIYAGLPILDELFSLDERNPDERERR